MKFSWSDYTKSKNFQGIFRKLLIYNEKVSGMVKKISRKTSIKSITYKLVKFMPTWFRSFFVRSKYYFFMIACFAVLMFLSSVLVVGMFELCQFLGM